MKVLLIKSLVITVLFSGINFCFAQNTKLIKFYENNYNLEKTFYKLNNAHTSIKPVTTDFLNCKDTTETVNFLLNKNLINKSSSKFTITLNPVFSSIANYSIGNKLHKHIETGLHCQASYKNKINFDIAYSLNLTGLPEFQQSEASANNFIPSWGKAFKTSGNNFYYHQFDGRISYLAGNYFNFQLGYGKNFIGDGYRSVFLSENAGSYPFFKATAEFWKLKYQIIYTALTHINGFHNDFSKQNKLSIIHYLSLNARKRFSFGFFETLVSNPGGNGIKRGLDINYFNPVIFYRPMDYTLGSPDNLLIGFSARLKLFDNLHLYSQFILDEFDFRQIKKRNGYWANKFGIQAGFKAFDAFGIKNLYLQGEANTIRPFTYSHANSILNYGHLYEPLAHPYGSNFYELIGIVNYEIKQKINLTLKSSYTLAGIDENKEFSVGQDIFRSYSLHQKEYNNTIAQGEKNHIIYNQIGVFYKINPHWQTEGFVQFSSFFKKNSLEKKFYNFVNLGIRTNIFSKQNDVFKAF